MGATEPRASGAGPTPGPTPGPDTLASTSFIFVQSKEIKTCWCSKDVMSAAASLGGAMWLRPPTSIRRPDSHQWPASANTNAALVQMQNSGNRSCDLDVDTKTQKHFKSVFKNVFPKSFPNCILYSTLFYSFYSFLYSSRHLQVGAGTVSRSLLWSFQEPVGL